MQISRSRVITILSLLAAAFLLYFFRPLAIIHGPLMYLWKYPLVWFAPLVVFALVAGAWGAFNYARRNKPVEDKDDYYSRSYGYGVIADLKRRRRARGKKWWDAPVGAGVICAILTGFLAMIIAPMLTGQAIYNHYSFEEITDLPEAGEVRVMPKQVAEQLSSSGFNSSTEKLTDGHIIRTPEGELAWSFEQAPSGIFRHFTQKTQGMGLLNAEQTDRNLTLEDAEFEIAPNVRITDRLTWMAYKTHFFTDVAETVFILTPEGEPLLLAPYISYEGFPVRVPVLGGVYVVHPDGEVEDLTPHEAASREEITQSGRLFPEALARRVQDSYKYNKGIWNRLFVHENQTNIADTEGNPQPYLMDFGDLGTKWVSTAKPSKSESTNGVFLTDTVSGETEIWKASEDKTYTGNGKALDIVKGLSIPGVVFSSGEEDEGGKFQAVEPRPLFIDGTLMFLISVIPDSANTVTKSVIVNAQSNKVVEIFEHDTDPSADENLKRFIQTGQRVIDDPRVVIDDPENISNAELDEILTQLEALEAEEDALLRELRNRLEAQSGE